MLGLIVAVVGLPINDIFGYLLLAVACIVVLCGEISARPILWIAAVLVVAIVIAAKLLLSPPRIDEGHNVFLGEHADVLQAGLPPEVFHFMADEFDRQYPVERRCDPATLWCWRGQGVLYQLRLRDRDGVFPSYRPCNSNLAACITNYGFPNQTFAFSADAIFDRPLYSRRVTAIDFSDPAWLRLGFLNEGSYNWWSRVSDVRRALRNLPFWMGIERWRITMPYFVMYRFPAAYAGGSLCWRGEVLWEGPDTHFGVLPHASERCRAIAAEDTGRRIFGVAIKPDTLAMRLDPPWPIRLWRWAIIGLTLLATAGAIGLLVRLDIRKTILPFTLVGLGLVVVAIFDVTAIGGLRAQEGGNDGLFYEAAGRTILQYLLAGDITSALEGGEKVFYFGGPGLRYLRALEKLFFGDTALGYLSLLLLLPVVGLTAFRRFLSARLALVLTLIFVATPLGAFFGSSYFLYVKYALQGFADPAAYILFLCGFLLIVGATAAGPRRGFGPACAGALLLALAVMVRPVVVPAAGVLLAGAGMVALWRRQWGQVMGLCVGFLPVLLMPLHNWYYGDVFVLFSANAAHPKILTMPPSAYAAALREISNLDFAGAHVRQAADQVQMWLNGFVGQARIGGRLGQVLSLPAHAAAVALVAYVAAFGRRLDPWLRLTAVATLAQHSVGLFYLGTARYYFLSWFLTMLVVAAWAEGNGLELIKRRFPDFSRRVRGHPLVVRISSALSQVEAKISIGRKMGGLAC